MRPKYWELGLSILSICDNKKSIHLRELIKPLEEKFDLTDAERNQLTKRGRETLFQNKVRWVIADLKKAGLVDKTKNIISITEDGQNTLKRKPARIDRKYLLTIPKYHQYHSNMLAKRKEHKEESSLSVEYTPEEMLSTGHGIIRSEVENELLEKINENTPEFFERLVLDLIRKMGYGIDHKVLGRTGDGGIDGVVKEDKLGLDEIYFQAKRWQNTVPIHQVRDFVGALSSKKSKKGIFITSSTFSSDTYDFVKNIDAKIILINGNMLTEYMYEYNLGVNVRDTFEVKKVDDDYFTD